MALTYDGSDGLFTRLGKLIGMMDAVRTHQANLKTELADIQGEYSSADSYMIAGLVGSIESRIQEAGGILDDIRAAAETTLIEMCFAEASTSTTNAMRAKTLRDALIWLIRQMDADSETIDGTTVTKSSLSLGGSNIGTGNFVYSTEAPNVLLASTNDWPNIRSEIVEARCVQDAQDGSIAYGSEIFELRGQPGYPPLDYRFPAGSGRSMRIPTICASVDNGPRGQNILTNSDMEEFTSNVPNQWTVSSGTAGTEFQTSATPYRGVNSLTVVGGTGSTFKIRQQMGVSSGTFGRLVPDKPFVIGCAMKRSGVSTGTIRLAVEDGSGNIIDSGSFKLDIDTSAITTSFAQYTVTLRAPRSIPEECYFSIQSTVALTGKGCFIDEIVLAELMPLAAGGQAFGVIAGEADWAVDDNARLQFTNNDEGAFVRALDRLFDMYGLGLSLPADYSGTETILDSLIS
jgi:hypothetical protein